jgi:hypothetical protein
VVFQDPSLEDILKYPISQEELINAHGVGEEAKYGKAFLELISRYVLIMILSPRRFGSKVNWSQLSQ